MSAVPDRKSRRRAAAAPKRATLRAPELGVRPDAAAPGAPESTAQAFGFERDYWQAQLRARLLGGTTPASAPLLHDTRLHQLVQLFGLTPFDSDIVAALWTAAYAADLRAELAARDGYAGHLTVAGLARAFGHEPRVRLASESSLRLWRLVTEHPFIEGSAALAPDAQLIAWLDGEHELDRALVGYARALPVEIELPSWQLDLCAERLRAGLRDGIRWRVRFASGDAVAAQSAAAALARRLGMLALRVPAPAAGADEALEHAIRVQRQCYLDRCAACWPAGTTAIAWPDAVMPFPLQIVLGGDAPPPHGLLRDLVIVLPEPDLGERLVLWQTALPQAAAWPHGALEDLSLRVEASTGEILRVAATEPRDAHEAAAMLRESAAQDLDGLTQRLPCHFAWDDLVVPAPVRERLQDVAFEARERARLWAEPEAARLYPQGRGLVALLCGPPGTGKTMSAQVIAADLGLDLLRVDISRILSKWVGETAQHLQKVLGAPASRRAVLFFDEADALFGKRIEDTRQAQDHFINMDLSHLMIALESYTGVVLLATNLKANMDGAFARRIRHTIDFTLPDTVARAAIWTRAVQALFGAPDAATRDAIARVARVACSGAQIKNAALSAAFAARRSQRAPDAALLSEMLARELAKDGAGLSARELAATLEAAL